MIESLVVASLTLQLLSAKVALASTPEAPKLPLEASLVSKTSNPTTIEETIAYWAKFYGIDVGVAVATAQCESSLNPKAVGDHGLAHQIFQFHEATFNKFKKEAGLDLDYTDTSDNARLYAWAIANGYANHWTCDKKVFLRQ